MKKIRLSFKDLWCHMTDDGTSNQNTNLRPNLNQITSYIHPAKTVVDCAHGLWCNSGNIKLKIFPF